MTCSPMNKKSLAAENISVKVKRYFRLLFIFVGEVLNLGGLGHLPKRGDNCLRSLLIQGAKSAVMSAHKRSDQISQWAATLRERVGWQKAAVALANKNARILWAVMTKGEEFNPRHVGVKPGAYPIRPLPAL